MPNGLASHHPSSSRRRSHGWLLSIAVVSLVLAACGGGGGAPPAQTLTLTPPSAAMAVGQNVVLTASLNGSATGAVNWSSSNPAVATVNAGTVTGVSAGSATVTASLNSNPSVQATASITVTVPGGGPGPDAAVVSVAGGLLHSLALLEDGSMWAWGTNLLGQLGVGPSVIASETPLRVAAMGIFTAIAAGDHFSLALREDGTVWAWGSNLLDPIGGHATGDFQHTPVQVAGVDGAKAIAASTTTAAALLDDGTVVAWGANTSGALGRGEFLPVSDPVPAPVVGLTEVTQLEAGGTGSEIHLLALREDGSVWAWGSNMTAALGVDLTTPARPTAEAVPGLLDEVIQVAAGTGFSVAVLEDGTVRAWGAGNLGQLGDGERDAFSVAPVTVTGLDDIVEVATGQQHVLALHSDGTVSAWGANGFGQLGIGLATGWREAPEPVPGLHDIETVAAGVQFSLAVDDSGRIWGWGSNLNLQLGLPQETEQQNSPALIWE